MPDVHRERSPGRGRSGLKRELPELVALRTRSLHEQRLADLDHARMKPARTRWKRRKRGGAGCCAVTVPQSPTVDLEHHDTGKRRESRRCGSRCARENVLDELRALGGSIGGPELVVVGVGGLCVLEERARDQQLAAERDFLLRRRAALESG